MATLTGATIASTYPLLLKIESGGIDGTMRYIQDGDATNSSVKISTAGATVLGTLTVSADDTGADVRIYSATTNEGLHYDASEDELGLLLTTKLKFHDIGGGEEIFASANGHLEINAGTTLDITAPTVDVNVSSELNIDGNVDLNGALDVSGTLTVGADGSGTDVIFYSGTAGDNFTWDASEELLTITGTNGQTALNIADGNLVVADSVDIEGDIDVNGTANLDAVDIDGTFTQDAGNVVFNEDSGDYDFRVESNGNINMLFVDAGNNRVGIGTATPDGMLDISSSLSGWPNVYIQNSSTSQQTGGSLIFTNIDTDTNLGNNIIIGEILAKAGDPSDDALINAGRIKFQMDGVGATNDIDGKIVFETGTGNGTLTERLTIKAAGNIGVGTDTPGTKLEVVGSFAANGPSSTFVTMSSGDTSPDVSTGNIFKSHGDGVTIDQFDGGICGQIITIISGGATVYDVTSSELNGGTTNITTAAGDVTMWVCESATDWHLLSWMDLSIDLSSGGF